MTMDTQEFARAREFHRSGDFAKAEDAYRRVWEGGRPSGQLCMLLGSACRAQGKLVEASNYLRQAVRLDPNYWDAVHNLAVCMAQLGNTEQACKLLRRAIEIKPQSVESLTDLAVLYKRLGRLDEALCTYEQAVRLKPSTQLHTALGTCLALQGRLAEAQAHFVEAVRLHPRNRAAHSNLLLLLSHDPEQDPCRLLCEHQWFDRLHGKPGAVLNRFSNTADPNRRLRIGYVSPDFRRHALTSFIEPILRHHSREKFELFAYAEVNNPDDVTARLQAMFDKWRFISLLKDTEVTQQIRNDGVDILVDLAGHTANNRLGVLTYKPAPVQVTYLGYAGTTGLTSIDYRLTDAIADPVGEPACHTEKLVHLEDCFCCFSPAVNGGVKVRRSAGLVAAES